MTLNKNLLDTSKSIQIEKTYVHISIAYQALAFLCVSDQGRNWRFVKGGGWAMEKVRPLNDAFSGHPKAKY